MEAIFFMKKKMSVKKFHSVKIQNSKCSNFIRYEYSFNFNRYEYSG